jgi:hypothetical protein
MSVMARERWTRRALGGAWVVALAAAAGMSCVGETPILSCAQGGDAGEPARLICPDRGGVGTTPICVDPTVDSRNCGACGNVCGPGQYCSASACAYPTSCADLLAQAGPGPDGEYVIQPAGRAAFAVYCAGLGAATPAEYLTLVNTLGNGATASNVSAYYCPNCADAAATYFEKVRIDPATLVIDVSDRTFSTVVTDDPSCWSKNGGACIDGWKNRFAEAGNCSKTVLATPGNIDLRGTPFSIDPSVDMVWDGWLAHGHRAFSADRKLVSFDGGGNCGATHPSNWILLLKQD